MTPQKKQPKSHSLDSAGKSQKANLSASGQGSGKKAAKQSPESVKKGQGADQLQKKEDGGPAEETGKDKLQTEPDSIPEKAQEGAHAVGKAEPSSAAIEMTALPHKSDVKGKPSLDCIDQAFMIRLIADLGSLFTALIWPGSPPLIPESGL